MIDIGAYKRGIEGKRVRRNRGIKILDPSTTSLQRRLDAAVGLTDGIGPFRSWNFGADEIKSSLQRSPALGTWQALDAVRDLGEPDR